MVFDFSNCKYCLFIKTNLVVSEVSDEIRLLASLLMCTACSFDDGKYPSYSHLFTIPLNLINEVGRQASD